jgi:fibronectin-binding autotransporter adhesin
MNVHVFRKAAIAALTAAATWAQATSYTWNTASGGAWNDSGKWSPGGVPGGSDAAIFAGTAVQTVTIGAGDQAASMITVTGSGQWTWNGTSTLTLGAGDFTYGSSGASTFSAVLAGTSKLIQNGGLLNVYNASNSFSGDVVINAGELQVGIPYDQASTNDLGSQAKMVWLGSAAAGSNDATLHVASRWDNSTSFTQPITVRSGNDGKKILMTGPPMYDWDFGAVLTGNITLQTNLTLLVPRVMGADNKWAYRFRLQIYGGVSGNGDITKEGLGTVYFFGTNTYAGKTTVNGGKLFVSAWPNYAPQATVGDFLVKHGELLSYLTNGLGPTNNTITLGSPGAFGGLSIYGPQWGASHRYHNIKLAGNGGIFFNRADSYLTEHGVISGPSRLILAHAGNLYLDNDNTYTGDTLLADGWAMQSSGNRRIFGASTNFTVYQGGVLAIYAATNIHPNAKVRLVRNPNESAVYWGGRLVLGADYIPTIDTNSTGILCLDTWSGPVINTRLADGAQPLGNGTMFLANINPYGVNRFTGTSLAALVANDATHTYRFGNGANWGTQCLRLISGSTGALQDLNAVPHNVQVGMRITAGTALYTPDDQTFSGALTVHNGAAYVAEVGASGNPLGNASGAVNLHGSYNFGSAASGDAASLKVSNQASVTRTLNKGAVIFDGSSLINIDAGGATPSWTTTLALASLSRTGRSTLGVQGQRGSLNSFEKLIVTGGLTSQNGMVAPYYWNYLDNQFITYDGNGFKPAGWDRTGLTGALPTEKVYTTGESVPGGISVYALRADGALTGGNTLTVAGGGVILAGSAATHTAPLAFGSAEGIIYAVSNHTFSGTITGSGGLTKSGKAQLSVFGNNEGLLSGGITINEGDLVVHSTANLGGSGNTVTVNGGRLLCDTASAVISNNVVLGYNGGGVCNLGGVNLTYAGVISGTGALMVNAGPWAKTYISNPSNSYSGGTFVGGGPNFIEVTVDGRLGDGGAIVVDTGYEASSAENQTPRIYFDGEQNVGTNQTIVLRNWASTVYFQSPNGKHSIGSFEGNGGIRLGYAWISPVTLTTGYDNRDTEFFGTIDDTREGYSSWLIKAGTGKLTLWNECTYKGGTIVSNGTLVVNNWLNTDAPVFVYPNGTLDGIGTVGIVSNLGGTVKGNLYIRQLTMAPTAAVAATLGGTNALTDYSQLNVAEGVTLGGAALNLTLNFVPQVGQPFTILNNTSASAISGQFAQGQIVTGTYNGKTYYFRINYFGGSGNDITLTALPAGTLLYIR